MAEDGAAWPGGLIQAKVAGTNAAAAVTAAMLNEQLTPMLAEHLEGLGVERGSAEFNALMTAGSTLLGAAFDAASVTYTATVNNYLKHTEISAFVNAQKGCSTGKAADCKTLSDLAKVDKERQETIQSACASFSSERCKIELTNAGADFDALVTYQQDVWDKITGGTSTYEEMKPYLNKVALEVKDIAGPMKDYYYLMSEGNQKSPYWLAYKEIDSLNANDLANLWNATAAIASTRKGLFPNVDAPPKPGSWRDRWNEGERVQHQVHRLHTGHADGQERRARPDGF